ncbi:anaerobic ribonucleoside-triphosphate reductase [Spiroplasma clarkii]|uniref:Ribonucleoside-triphosphate reductase (Formate) n=1 Tax=Spiroplasma clarkii TaxID=2139 RepID=A0A1Y0L1L9_9MOLU|nr:anaerobic ribonucleoside triphosphate reductase [Spiroplasma clarkii]ARU91924.1 anaerobic ribonucleoside-triphosphate reductase [Spiroplasma clarkii]ATX71268.1 ribonucleoside-triphosphate reductase (formate) [Spiroplasma clarkii]
MNDIESIIKEMQSIVSIENNDIKNENANMSGETPSGKMMKFASISAKEYALSRLVDKKHADMHRKAQIHIHDLDYYPTKSATCVQYNIQEIFEGGFTTKNGHIREPQSIGVYAELAAIIFQTAQNEMHGGQAIPAFDFFMANGVKKSFKKQLQTAISTYLDVDGIDYNIQDIKNILASDKVNFLDTDVSWMVQQLEKYGFSAAKIEKLVSSSNQKTIREADQAMEGFIYNLNTQHSRGGNQVVFSSINLGTDTSNEGRQVMKSLLKALRAGLGNGETSIFPIVIFKVKEGINFSDADVTRVMQTPQTEWNQITDWTTPNFDLLLDSIATTSLRLFPNFMFLDQSYNQHKKWDINDPNRWMYEPATMGCRTRVFENINGEKTSVGRGNLSFTSINLPYLALELLENKGMLTDGGIDYSAIDKVAIKREFIKVINNVSEDIAKQLYDRYKFQTSAIAREFPFIMKNNILAGGETLKPNEHVEDVFKQGTLTIGFVGLAEALKALIAEHHGESDEAQQFGLEIIREINNVVIKWKETTHLNYGVIATPAESVAGRMARVTQNRFGNIVGVTEREYFTNSNHVPVYHNISAIEKIEKEAAYHHLTLGGSISYIELDGEAKKNLHAVLSVVVAMKNAGTNYGSLNHPVDRCKKCHYTSLIPLNCPKCGFGDISRTRRITGYLVGDLDGWNSGKQAEEAERVKHLSKNENT